MITEKRANKKRVLVGLSGGVDSSAASVILKEKGYSVTGIFLEFWEEGACCNSQAQERARDVCRRLNIPFYVLNVKREFKERVVNYFLESYKKGETPNPCVVCNKEVKFRTLVEKLISFDSDYIATGHYVRKDESGDDVRLLKGADKKKDQSYFLWNIKKEWLPSILFPLGELKKEEVRNIARRHDLPVANVRESQEVCFVDGSMKRFLKNNLGGESGDIFDKEGSFLGRHNGLFHYTIGQRKGLGLSGGPYYVLFKDLKNNQLVVTKDEKDICKKELFFKDGNFIRRERFPFEAEVKIRYNTQASKAIVEEEKVTFLKPQRAVATGQSAVFYKGEELIGGGVIK